MPNVFKYNPSSTEAKSLRKGNFYIGTGDVGKGPSDQTGFYNGVTVGTFSYVIVLHRGDNVPTFYQIQNDTELIERTNQIDPTGINLITNNPTPTTNTTGYATVGGVGTLTFNAEESAIRWLRTSYEAWGAYVWNNSVQNYEFDRFSDYTATFEWKFGPSHSANQSYSFQIINGPGSYTILGGVGLTASSTLQESGWYRFTRTHRPLQDGVGETIQYRIITGNPGGTTDIFWRKLEYYKTTRTTKEQCFSYFAGQSDKMIVNKDYDTIVTDGLVLNLDAGFLPSYPGTGSSWYDLGPSQSNGTLENGPIFDSDRWINFDGSNDRCSVPNQTFNSTSNSSFTIEIIFKRNSSTPGTVKSLYLIGNGSSSTNARVWFSFDDNNNGSMALNYYVLGGLDRYITLNSQLLDTNFHHSVQVIDKTNLQMIGYFDGVNKGNGTITSSSTSATNFSIGSGSSVNASVALLKIYNRVLSQSEILQNYYKGPIVTDGLVLALDAGNLVSYSGSGATWSDLTSNGNNGTLVNGPTFDSANEGSIVFDGQDDYATINTPIGSGDFTFNIWLRRQSTSTSLSFLFGRYSDAVDRGCMLFISNNNLFFRLGATASGDITLSSSLPLTGPNWTNVVASATRTSNVLLYRNGVLDVQTNISSQQGSVPNLNFIGTLIGNLWFLDANLGIVQVYNRALSASEILQNYNATKGRFGL